MVISSLSNEKKDEIEKILMEHLDERRFNHVKRVVEKAVYLANKHNAPIDKVEMGAYLHDISKFFEVNHMLQLLDDVMEMYPEILSKEYQTSQFLHGFAGAEYAKIKLNIRDKQILDSIRYHTIGKKDMDIVSKIVYLADAIEDERKWTGVEKTRKLAEIDLDKAILFELDEKLKYLISREALIHPNALEFRNSLINVYKK